MDDLDVKGKVALLERELAREQEDNDRVEKLVTLQADIIKSLDERLRAQEELQKRWMFLGKAVLLIGALVAGLFAFLADILEGLHNAIQLMKGRSG